MAERCCQCGQEGFQVPAGTAAPELGRKDKHIPFRIVVSGSVWLAVSGLSLYVGWQNVAGSPYAWREQGITEKELKSIDKFLTDYQEQFHAPPRSLDELLTSTNHMGWFSGEGPIVDGWGRAFHFSSDGTNCLITSYGRDGKPGGKGLDHDLTNKNWRPKEAAATFPQFLFDMPGGGIIASCLVCGGLAFVLSFFTIRMPDTTPAGLVTLGIKFVLTVIGALIIASVISVLHIPSGH